MKKQNILVLLPFEEEQKKQLIEKYKEVKFLFTDYKKVSLEQVKQAEAIIGNPLVSQLKEASNLAWLQLNSAGYEQYVEEGVLEENVTLTNATGAYGTAVGEHLLTMVLSMLKKIPDYRDYQKENEWVDLGQVRSIHDLNVLVVGLGDIGGHFAKLMKQLGNHIIGIKSKVSQKPSYVDEVYTLAKLDEVIGKADIVALTIPLTEQTKDLMNEERIGKMKQDAFLFNVGRGGLVEEKALQHALEKGIIAGAGIDVTKQEPLPKESPLWNTKNLLITPHCSGGFHLPETLTNIQEISMYNLEIFLNGGTYKNKIDR